MSEQPSVLTLSSGTSDSVPAHSAGGDQEASKAFEQPGSPEFVVDIRRRRSQLRASMDELDVALAQDTADARRWSARVGTAADGLADALDHHVAVHEGPDSFHAEVLAGSPHLASRVQWLQRDHACLGVALLEFRRTAATAPDRVGVRKLGADLLHLFERHRRRGAELVWDAIEFDLGGEH